IDGPQPAELARTGNIAVFETSVQAGNGTPIAAGGAIFITLADETTRTVYAEDLDEDGVPDSNIDGCAVTIYDHTANETGPDPTDEGEISITGTGNGDIACTFGSDPLNPGGPQRYTCKSTDPSA